MECGQAAQVVNRSAVGTDTLPGAFRGLSQSARKSKAVENLPASMQQLLVLKDALDSQYMGNTKKHLMSERERQVRAVY